MTLVCFLQKDGTATGSFLLTIARNSLTKRIEHLENVLNDLKKSHLLNQQSISSQIPNRDSNKERSSRQEDIEYLYRSIERKVFGRDKEREKIISMLRRGPGPDTLSSSTSKHYSVIGIYGIAGSGKSTLAQYVCDYEKAEGQHFDPVMFIHVSPYRKPLVCRVQESLLSALYRTLGKEALCRVLPQKHSAK